MGGSDDLSDFPAKPTDPDARRIRIACAITRVIAGPLTIFLGIGMLVASALAGRAEPIPAEECGRLVLGRLIGCGLVGPAVNIDHHPSDGNEATARPLRGVRGFGVTDGFPGGGTSWYEVDLARELANALRPKLARSATVKQSAGDPELQREPRSPAWWPTTRPAGTLTDPCDHSSLMLPTGGTRLYVRYANL